MRSTYGGGIYRGEGYVATFLQAKAEYLVWFAVVYTDEWWEVRSRAEPHNGAPDILVQRVIEYGRVLPEVAAVGIADGLLVVGQRRYGRHDAADATQGGT